MIKLACNSLIAVGEGQWMDAEEFVELAYKLRLDAVDFQLDRGLRSRDRDYLQRLKRACLRRGLPIGFLGIGSGFIGSAILPEVGAVGAPLPRDELRRRIDEVKAAVDDAAYIGAPCIRIFGGGIPEATEERGALWSEMIASYKEVADYAADRGVFIGLHNHPPVDSPNGDDIVRILKDTDRDNFTFILDTGRWKGSPGTPPMGVTDPGRRHLRIYGADGAVRDVRQGQNLQDRQWPRRVDRLRACDGDSQGSGIQRDDVDRL